MVRFAYLAGKFQSRIFSIVIGLALFYFLALPSDNPGQDNFKPIETFKVSTTQSCDQEPPEGYVQKIKGIVDGDGAETTLTRVTADRFRQDLASALDDNGKHGFNILTAEIIQDGEQHAIRVYGLNSNPNWPDQPLTPPEHLLECPQLSPPGPTGTIESTAVPVATNPAEVEAPPPTQSDSDNGNTTCIGGAFPLFLGFIFLFKRRRKQ